MRIRQLPSIIANQIAAGEVIERPASVIKELLENAMDADARKIQIEADYGGLSRIKVSDDGTGIVGDDLPLAIAAHATSKIARLEDLYALTSLGFRGEALASIASVAKLSICSRPAAQEYGMQLFAENGHIQLQPSARNQGTTVEVVDLFFNAPVRKKFLKSARTEYLVLEAVVKRFALSNPKIAISLKHNGRLVFELPPADCEKTILLRIKKLLGKQFVDNAIYLEVEQGFLKMQGFISGANYQRSQNDKQWFYINKRMVKDKLISHAVKQVYEPLLHPGRFPASLLYITLPPEEVDVNVHPTKHEVRFCQPRLVHDFIITHLSKALMQPAKKTSHYPLQQTKKTHIAVHERFAEYAAELEQSKVPESWCALNHAFILLTLHGISYLIDINAFQQQVFASRLKAQTLPLSKRPLLLPVRYNLAKKNLHHFDMDTWQRVLIQVGIEVHLISEEALLIRSIPNIMPNLNIEALFDKLCQVENLNEAQVLDFLPFCQTVDAFLLSLEEQKELLLSFKAIIEQEGDKHSWCLRLDYEQCRRLLYG
ncbi:DNA mismatch repair endonuclease MutL [Legionella londiniensis]|uniref:DNA mismatch repair protein MutL n=1 Tax=Legionella londiniensis TaxID=45068 RepID=A0A0W0VI02_9GAMM|nr:DNA mismatch repair endonuclease MutL [Legionella londiniensis]KTD19675.1 DNA mismatch repair protein MutL [Legionella londiniensis]STX92415.1 DNA mismatch repair protein MutL [Legionella londiniensis]